MKTIKKFALFLLYLLVSNVHFAQSDSVNLMINEGLEFSKKAYLQYDISMFLKARLNFEKAFELDKTNLLPLYYMTLIDYKILEVNLKNEDKTLFNKHYEISLKNAEQLEKDKTLSTDGKILFAAIYMMKIAVSPMSAVSLSPKVHALLDEAQKINPKKPYSYVIRGMMKYNTPGIFGGSYKDALDNFNYAVKLFEKEKDDGRNPVWGLIETLAWIGRTNEQLENYEAAKFVYQKALDIEPEYLWIKKSLLPKLEKKMGDIKQ